MSEWYYENNIGLEPENISANSDVVVSWVCSKCHKKFEQAISSRNIGCGCTVCSSKKAVPGNNDLATLYPEIASEWDYERNTLNIETTVAGSNKKSVLYMQRMRK